MSDQLNSDQCFLDFLSKFLVGFAFVFKRRDEEKHRFAVISMFPIVWKNHWFLMGAGHAIQEMKQAIEDREIEIISRSLIDHCHSLAEYREGFPFDLLSHRIFFLDDEIAGHDYAIVDLNLLDISCLKANGIEPLRLPPTALNLNRFKKAGIIGFPLEKSIIRSGPSTVTAPIYLPIQLSPQVDHRTSGDLCEAEVINAGELKSLNGLSGGPVFGFEDTAEGIKGYTIGIQSRASGVQKVRFFPTQVLTTLFEEHLGPDTLSS